MASYSPYVKEASGKYGIPAAVLYGLIQIESGGNAAAKSPKNAGGLTQFIPSTARSYGVQYGTSAAAQRSQVLGAAHYLSDLGYHKNPRLALRKYNAGPGAPQNAGDYDSKVLNAARQYGSIGRGSAGSVGSQGASGAVVSTDVSSTPASVDEPGSALMQQLLAQQLQRPQQYPSSGVTPPSFSATNSLHIAGQTPVSLAPPVQQTLSLADQLTAIRAIQGSTLPDTGSSSQKTTVTPVGGSSGGSAKFSGAGGHYPLGKRGKIIGTPHTGTHTLGNWQSDNAVDIGVPVGTPVYAVADGTIGGNLGSLGAAKGSRFAGLRVQVNASNNAYWYGHLSKLTVKAGQKVRRGQLIGYSGSANGVAHLHFSEEHGDPRRTVG